MSGKEAISALQSRFKVPDERTTGSGRSFAWDAKEVIQVDTKGSLLNPERTYISQIRYIDSTDFEYIMQLEEGIPAEKESPPDVVVSIRLEPAGSYLYPTSSSASKELFAKAVYEKYGPATLQKVPGTDVAVWCDHGRQKVLPYQLCSSTFNVPYMKFTEYSRKLELADPGYSEKVRAARDRISDGKKPRL